MKRLYLDRELDINADGTFGTLRIEGHIFYTVERPWKNNQTGISCIPEGVYMCKMTPSTRNRAAGLDKAYEVCEVPNRTNIKIHVANWPTDLEGCIGLGYAVGTGSDGRRMILRSRDAITDFYNAMKDEPFILDIERHK